MAVLITAVLIVGIYKYSTIWHSDSAVERISLGYQWNDGSLGISKPSTEIHDSQ